jgi:hypothetical protein
VQDEVAEEIGMGEALFERRSEQRQEGPRQAPEVRQLERPLPARQQRDDRGHARRVAELEREPVHPRELAGFGAQDRVGEKGAHHQVGEAATDGRRARTAAPGPSVGHQGRGGQRRDHQRADVVGTEPRHVRHHT